MSRFLSLLLSRAGMFASNGLMILLTARWLGAAGRGEASLLLAAISISGLIAQIPAGIALVYWMPRFSHRKVFKLGLITQLFMALMLGIVMGPLYGFLGLLHHLTHLFRYFLLAFNRMEEDAWVYVIQGVSQVLLFILFHSISSSDGHSNFIWAFALSQLLGLALGFFWFIKAKRTRTNDLPELNGNEIRHFLVQGAEVQGGNILYLMMTRWMFFRLEQSSTLANTGVFSVAIAAVEALLLASSSMAAMLMNQIAQDKEPDKMKKKAVQVSRLSFWVTTSGLIIVCFLPTRFWTTLLGPEYESLASLLRILSPGIALMALSTVLLHAYSGLGRYRINLMVVGAALVISLIFSYWLMKPEYGLYGAGIVATIAYSSLALLAWIRFVWEYKVKFSYWLPDSTMWTTLTQYVRNRRFFS